MDPLMLSKGLPRHNISRTLGMNVLSMFWQGCSDMPRNGGEKRLDSEFDHTRLKQIEILRRLTLVS